MREGVPTYTGVTLRLQAYPLPGSSETTGCAQKPYPGTRFQCKMLQQSGHRLRNRHIALVGNLGENVLRNVEMQNGSSFLLAGPRPPPNIRVWGKPSYQPSAFSSQLLKKLYEPVPISAANFFAKCKKDADKETTSTGKPWRISGSAR